MFSFLFGTPKPNASAVAVGAKPGTKPGAKPDTKPDPLKAIEKLQKEESNLEKKVLYLQTQVTMFSKQALDANTANKKEVAKSYLLRRHNAMKQIETFNAMSLRLMEQRMALEMGSMTHNALNVMQHASNTLKEQQNEWDVEKVSDLTDDIAETMGAHNEVNELLRGPLISGGPSDEDLAGDLEALMAETPATATPVAPVVAPVPTISSATTSSAPTFPSIPTNSVVYLTEMERELAN